MSKFEKISASKFETSRFYQLPKFLNETNYKETKFGSVAKLIL